MDRYVAVVLGECFFTRDDHFIKFAIAESFRGQTKRMPKSFSHFSRVLSTQTNLSQVESAYAAAIKSRSGPEELRTLSTRVSPGRVEYFFPPKLVV
jgi:hypothetical protein